MKKTRKAKTNIWNFLTIFKLSHIWSQAYLGYRSNGGQLSPLAFYREAKELAKSK